MLESRLCRVCSGVCCRLILSFCGLHIDAFWSFCVQWKPVKSKCILMSKICNWFGWSDVTYQNPKFIKPILHQMKLVKTQLCGLHRAAVEVERRIFWKFPAVSWWKTCGVLYVVLSRTNLLLQPFTHFTPDSAFEATGHQLLTWR